MLREMAEDTFGGPCREMRVDALRRPAGLQAQGVAAEIYRRL